MVLIIIAQFLERTGLLLSYISITNEKAWVYSKVSQNMSLLTLITFKTSKEVFINAVNIDIHLWSGIA